MSDHSCSSPLRDLNFIKDFGTHKNDLLGIMRYGVKFKYTVESALTN